MLTIMSIPDEEPLLTTSPLIRGLLKMADYIAEHGGIGLTASGAFNRKFVHWAAAEFEWPGFTEDDLFAVNKVLDEMDFPPLGDLHALLRALRLGRHVKGRFVLTRAGKDLVARPGRLFAELLPHYLFRLDHGASMRSHSGLLGSWDVFLNVINVEAERGASLNSLRRTLYGQPDSAGYDETALALFIGVLRPLCWAGLISMDLSYTTCGDPSVVKTGLWRRYLRLETDRHLGEPRLH
jgi:hypothetical protein